MNVAAILASKGLGPQNSTKKFAHRYLENMFSKFSGLKLFRNNQILNLKYNIVDMNHVIRLAL